MESNKEEVGEAVGKDADVKKSLSEGQSGSAVQPTKLSKSDEDERGLDDEMEAMFGESSSVEAVGAESKKTTIKTEKTSSSQPAVKVEDAVEEEEDEDDSTDDDEPDLEDIMEALHAGKTVTRSTRASPRKQPESGSSLGLKDVLQALTEDLEPQAADSDKTEKPSVGPNRNSKKSQSKNGDTVRQTRNSVKLQEVESENEGESEDVEEAKEEAPPPKRKRGRPPGKNKKLVKKLIEEVDSDSDFSTDRGSDSDDELIGVRDSGASAKKTYPGAKMVSKSNKVCVLPDCKQQCFPQFGISLHRFPSATNTMRAYWLRLIDVKPPGPHTAYICSAHFVESDYTYDDKRDPSDTFYRKLRPKAIPTRELPVSDEVIQEVKDELISDEKSATKKTTKESSEDEEDAEEATSLSPSPTRSSLSSQQTSSRTPTAKGKSDADSKIRTPGTNCSVPCCGNNLFKTRAEGRNISYYRFPFNNILAEKWIKKIGDSDLNARTARICSEHFAEKDYDGTGGEKKNLKAKAVPSLYLTEKKPVKDSEEDSDADEKPTSKRRGRRRAEGESKEDKSTARKGKPDTSFITMPLPIIEVIEIKSEPQSEDETFGGLDYAASNQGSEDDDEYLPNKKIKIEPGRPRSVATPVAVDKSQTAPVVKRPRGRPRKDGSTAPAVKVKTVSLTSLTMPVVSLERLGQRVIDAADSGTLRVRIKENVDNSARRLRQKPGPKSKRKQPDSDSETAPARSTGPQSRKKKPEPVSAKAKRPRIRKVLKMSDYDSDSDDDPPVAVKSLPLPPLVKSTPSSQRPIAVKLAELPKFLLDKGLVQSAAATGDATHDIDTILASDKSDKEKIIQLIEQRISKHTKIIEEKSMGPQQLADHNKILLGSALVLKKFAEKTAGKSGSEIIPLNVSDNTVVTPGRTIVLKKVADPTKLGLKPPTPLRPLLKPDSTTSMPASPSKVPPPLAIISPQNSVKSTPTKLTNNVKPSILLSDEPLPSDDHNKLPSQLEKIRDYDNLMKRYLSAVLDKNVMSKKYTESKETQKQVESKLLEKVRELEAAKKRMSAMQTKMNRINSALEDFLTPNQMKLALAETKKVAWSPEEMLTAFTIKHLSKACYLYLRHKLNYPLPGMSSLQRWLSVLSKEKNEDDEDNIADDDISEKDGNQELLEEGGPVVVNEITGTLEEINASGDPGEEDDGTEAGGVKSTSPFQFVFENNSSSDPNRKVIILKEVPKTGDGKVKSKLQISGSENDVNLSGLVEKSDGKGQGGLYRLLPGAKTISMNSKRTKLLEEATALQQTKRRLLAAKSINDNKKISFHRLPPSGQQRQLTKVEPGAESGEQYDELMELGEGSGAETIVKPEDVDHVHLTTDDQQQQDDGGNRKFFTISELNCAQMEEHVVENVEHLTGDDETHQFVVEQTGGLEGLEDQSQQMEQQQQQQQQQQTSATLEDIVHLSGGSQQITFTTTEDLARSHHFAQIAYAATHGEADEMGNMTAVVINDIDEEQLNTLLMSNVVQEKDGGNIEGVVNQAFGGSKKIIYQTIDQDKNVIVLQPDTQAFVEDDEGSSSGAPRVYIINEEGQIVSASGGDAAALASEIGYIDSDAFAELGYKLSSDPDHSYSIGNLIENYAIPSPVEGVHKK